MKYGYARVSTAGQDLQGQIEILEKEGCEKIYSEHFTGTKTERPQFSALLEKLKKGDMLVVTKLDRFARSATKGSELVKNLINKGISVQILNMGIMDNKSTSKLIRNIFFSFAEFERDMIVERTQEGKAIAKLRDDYREGRPKKFTKKQIAHAMQLKETGMSYKLVAETTGISKSTLARENAKRKLPQ
ncbi:recombinase family protein [Viridibacillus arvi]|uniref:recombinase family protein n=1 Tax=Viridibacillus arvi TaxID=263475 RepID=UPI0036AB947C